MKANLTFLAIVSILAVLCSLSLSGQAPGNYASASNCMLSAIQENSAQSNQLNERNWYEPTPGNLTLSVGASRLNVTGLEKVKAIKLGFQASESGTYTLEWEGTPTGAGKSIVILEDIQTGTKTGMLDGGSYTFMHNPVNPNHRFNVYEEKVKTKRSAASKSEIISMSEKRVRVQRKEYSEALISIFSLTGQRVVFDQTTQDVNTYRVEDAGYYMVYIQSSHGLEAQKLFIQ